ncbi:MAG: TrbC/VirB2 family protein [Maricaulaceae bacterium]
MKKLTKIALATTALTVMATPAFAATDGTGDFDAFYTKIVGWVSGGLGKTIGVIGLGIGAFQVLRNAYASAAGFVVIGLLLSLGPSVLDSIMGAVI